MSIYPEAETPHNKVARVKKILPYNSIFLLPQISASFPNGTSITAEDKRNAMAIQLRDTAFIDNSLLMLGRAIFTADPIKGLKKEDISITANKIPLLNCLSDPVCIIILLEIRNLFLFFFKNLLLF
jgi:hypothetical protein